ncbi:MAG: hypothetical protein HFE78_07505 [Clostridiales bacterium]|nr:hypothetical protein [Clostridiales bacterium]
MKEKCAKMIRVISIPPILVSALLVFLLVHSKEVVHNATELCLAILFLAVIPALAYPLQKVFPAYRDKGRTGQRNLAFLFTIAGYSAGLVYAVIGQVSKGLFEIHLAYFLTCAVLLFINKVLHKKASGHAAGIVGPLLFLIRFTGLWMIPVTVVIYGLIFWSSVILRRHTPGEFVLGTLTSFAAFAITLLISMIVY